MIAFSSPLKISNHTLKSTDNYDQIVRDQLIDALTTNQGERLMHPDWGCNIQSVLYDPASALERHDTAAYIRDRLVHLVPRALIKNVSVNVSEKQPNLVYIDISYKSSSYSTDSTVSVALNMSNTATGGQ
jgi:hypothetical protein